MTAEIFAATGIRKPEIEPEVVASLARHYADIERAAADVARQLDEAVSLTVRANQGAAADAFLVHATGDSSAKAQLERLGEAAAATSYVHREVARVLGLTCVQMDAIAVKAANTIWHLRRSHAGRNWIWESRVIKQAQADLLAVSRAAAHTAESLYSTIAVPASMGHVPMTSAEVAHAPDRGASN